MFCFSDRQDSRSHSSRRSSPESERQARSRAGSYDSRERDRDRDQLDRERERNRQLQNQQRDWEPEPRDWGGRALRGNREPVREREIRERERLLPEGPLGHDKIDRERERILPFNIQAHREPKSKAEVKMERIEYEPLLPREALINAEKPVNSSIMQGELSQPEKIDGVEGKSSSTLLYFRLIYR